MRYTEAKMQAITAEMLQDLDKETVSFSPNFDATIEEPDYLPAKLPNLLLMGSEGIAVGMATKIPPHNLNEVIDAIVFMISKAKFDEPEKLKEGKKAPDYIPNATLSYDVTLDDLM